MTTLPDKPIAVIINGRESTLDAPRRAWWVRVLGAVWKWVWR